jgi:hypothetical protein
MEERRRAVTRSVPRKARLLDGHVRMTTEQGLDPESKGRGFVLMCVGYADGNESVALLLADQRIPQMDGVMFLLEAMQIFPDALIGGSACCSFAQVDHHCFNSRAHSSNSGRFSSDTSQ